VTKKFDVIKDIDGKRETLTKRLVVSLESWCQSSYEVDSFESLGKWNVSLCMFDEMWKILCWILIIVVIIIVKKRRFRFVEWQIGWGSCQGTNWN